MSALTTFEAYGKTPRLNKTIVVTEKIDGTNGGIIIRPIAVASDKLGHEVMVATTDDVGEPHYWAVGAQSRNRFVSPTIGDNAGFGAWVWEHAAQLVTLGPGRHFGEWWGQGIQRGYGLDHKRFSLFNAKWAEGDRPLPDCCNVVPVLGRSDRFDTNLIESCVDRLVADGSQASPGFMSPEGVIVYHSASGQLYKRLIENDDKPKSAVA